jgi:hypothetical protein
MPAGGLAQDAIIFKNITRRLLLPRRHYLRACYGAPACCRRDLCRSETGPGRTPCCGQFATRHRMLLELLLVATQLGGLAEPAGSGASPGTAALVPMAIGRTWSHSDTARNIYERRIPLMIIHTKYTKRRLNMARGPPMWLQSCRSRWTRSWPPPVTTSSASGPAARRAEGYIRLSLCSNARPL